MILADGSPAEIRTVQPQDRGQVLALHEGASDLSLYRRFFSLNRPHASRYAEQVCIAQEGTWSLVAVAQGRIVGLATAVQTVPGAAEVAVMVDERLHAVGIGTLLVEHLAVWCGGQGVRRFIADVLIDNAGMIRVFHDAGFDYVEEISNGVMSLSLEVALTPGYLSATAGRQRLAESRSVARILEPATVAVVGVSGSGHGIGRAVLANVLEGGFQGEVHAVGRHLAGRRRQAGASLPEDPRLHSWRDTDELPEGIDLVVVAVPAGGVRDVVAALARRRAHSCVVLGAGFADEGLAGEGARLQAEVTALARESGIRLVGPNALGVLSNLRRTRLDATFAAGRPAPGRLAIASQSGGVGVALLEAARARGTGVACFVSTGNKADVSSNDLLMAWTDDPAVDAAALYLESFKDPQRFARVASAFSARKPLLAVFGGRSAPGTSAEDAGSSVVVAGATPGRALKALFNAAGVVEVSGLDDLVDTARLLEEQPLPAGRRVALVVNAGGMGALSADAARDAGLGVAAGSPVDLGADATPEAFGDTVRSLLGSGDVDAVLVVAVGTAVTDVAGIASAVDAARRDESGPAASKPVLQVTIGPDEGASRGPVTAFGSIDRAVSALAHAVHYADWRAGRTESTDPRSAVPPLPAGPRPLAGGGGRPATRWLAYDEARSLLGDFGIVMGPGTVAHTEREAVSAAHQLGFPVVVKTAVPAIVHKSDNSLVHTGVAAAAGVRRAVRSIHAVTGPGSPVLVQQAASGVEIAVGMFHDERFGPLLLVASGGVSGDLWDDQVLLLPPVGAEEVRAALGRLRTWPLLVGFRGSPAVDVDPLVALVRRVSDLAVARPDVCELDLNPVMVSEDGVRCVDAKVRLLEGGA